MQRRRQRHLRDLTRHRAQLHAEHTRCANRIHKVLQDANIKLSSVATDILGKSGRDMLAAPAAGQDDPSAMAALARGKPRKKIPDLKQALRGHVMEHHRFMLEQLLDHLALLEEQLASFSSRIEKELRPFVDDELLRQLDAIPGVNRVTIENVVAEIGVDMDQFPTAEHLGSWAGLCPGNEGSAGKQKRSRTTKGNVGLLPRNETAIQLIVGRFVEERVPNLRPFATALALPRLFKRQLAQRVIDQTPHLLDPPSDQNPNPRHGVVEHRNLEAFRRASNPAVDAGIIDQHDGIGPALAPVSVRAARDSPEVMNVQHYTKELHHRELGEVFVQLAARLHWGRRSRHIRCGPRLDAIRARDSRRVCRHSIQQPKRKYASALLSRCTFKATLRLE